MATYSQTDRSLEVVTPLGRDALLMTGFEGREGISELFRFELRLLAERGRTIQFQQVLGKPISFYQALERGRRVFNGVCSRLSQGGRDGSFTAYRLEVVPAFWFLTKIVRSRIFQQAAVPDILRKVLKGIDFELRLTGDYEPRDYCAQYDESDFAFASRLMEEEGIYYYFRHEEGSHTMVVSDFPEGHANAPGGRKALYDEVEGGGRDEARVTRWEKSQEIRSGKVTLWDHSFELPGKNLEADSPIQGSARVGEASHALKIGQNDKLEIYRFPGEYAQRYDGVDPAGGDRPSDVQKVFSDNKRTARIRMEEEAARAVTIRGESRCAWLTAGHRFQLDRHPDGDGEYVLTAVEHHAELAGDYRSNGFDGLAYRNEFTCLPVSIPYRPERLTPRPRIAGTQSAVVTGPKGEEIFTDKYGRVKVQFPWDREGKHDANSSCWIRVATPWAGTNWGSVNVPRIGQEVVVAFEHGDPDRPIIVGSVFNAAVMPPFPLPESKTISGLKSQTHKGQGYNEMVMDDAAGKERIRIHGQHNMDTTVENDQTTTIHNNRTDVVDVDDSESIGNNQAVTVNNDQVLTVNHDRTKSVANNETTSVGVDRRETVGGNEVVSIGGDRTVGVAGTDSTSVSGMQNVSVAADQSNQVAANQNNVVGASHNEAVGLNRTASVGLVDTLTSGLITNLTAGLVMNLSAGVTLTLTGPGGTIQIGPGGIHIKGKQIIIEGDTVHINP